MCSATESILRRIFEYGLLIRLKMQMSSRGSCHGNALGMTIIIHSVQLFKLHPFSLSRPLFSVPFRSKYINKCTRRLDSWRQFAANSRQCLPEPWPNYQKHKPAIKENIYTLPNLLTLSRIFSCPVLGWSILVANYHLAAGLLVYAGLTDLVGVICRPWGFFRTNSYVSFLIYQAWRSFSTPVQHVLCSWHYPRSCGR